MNNKKEKELGEKAFYGCFLILTGFVPSFFGIGTLINALFFEKVKLFGFLGYIGLSLMSLLGILIMISGVIDIINVWKNL